MELELLFKFITEKWIIYGLFIIIVVGFIRKGIPFLVNVFKELNASFLLALQSQQKSFDESCKQQQRVFELTLNKISEDFVKKMEASDSWHQKHNEKLDNLANLIINKK